MFRDFFDSKSNLAVVTFFLFGIFLLAVGGGLFFFKSSNADGDIQIISSAEQTVVSQEVVVHVDGAVAAPGVYRLDPDSRVDDLIRAAGGLTEGADQTRINLAAKVADGQKLYVFAVGEQSGSSVVGSSIAGQSVSALVNINTATEAELDKLPGIGPVTAQKIIASRPYSVPEDLLTKKVVNRSVFEKIRGLVAVY